MCGKSQLLDEFTETSAQFGCLDYRLVDPGENRVGFTDATFSWSVGGTSGSVTPSQRNFHLRIDGDLYFPEGKLSLIIGPTGSGKSSLLNALLGEMHFIPSGLGSSFSLPRKCGIAYAAQESWVQNETVKVCWLSHLIYYGVTTYRIIYSLARLWTWRGIRKVSSQTY